MDEEYDGCENHKTAKLKQELKVQKAILNNLLSKNFIPSNFSFKYPTNTGSLVMPLEFSSNKELADTSALAMMKKEKENFTDLVSKVKIKVPIKKTNKKKYKGFEKRKLKLKKEKEAYKKQMEENSD